MIHSDPPFSPTTGYTPVPSTPTNESDTNTKATIKPASMSRLRMMIGATTILSILVLIRNYIYTYGVLDLDTRASSVTTTTMRIQQSNSNSNSIPRVYTSPLLANGDSWMERIVAYRTTLADVSHELKLKAAHDRGSSSNPMVDVSILYEAVTDTVRDVGVRGLLFEVLSDDFEYYVYSDESVSYDSEDYDDDSSIDELDAYWRNCASKHGVGKGCNEWDVWWIYHYIGAILTDMLLEDHELLWDGSSGEMITIQTATADTGASNSNINSNSDEELDVAMGEFLHRIHRLQAGMPYVTQASFHAQHALIWRYIERSSGRLSTSYPWELARNFCRGDGSIPKGIVGRPVNKGIDHECFHGFGHAMFYAVVSRQLQLQLEEPRLDGHSKTETKTKTKQQRKEEASHMFLRPHGGFELSPESYCEVYNLCRGASPPSEKRRAMDPNDEASGNSYRICFEGFVHSVRLLSEDSPQMTNKQTAIHTVEHEMKRCAKSARKEQKQKQNNGSKRASL